MFKRSLPLIIACFLVCLFTAAPGNSFASEKWIVMGSTVWTALGNNLQLDHPNPDLRVRINAAGSGWIITSPPIALGTKVKQLALCYKTPNPGTFIGQIRLTEYILTTANVEVDIFPIPESSQGTCFMSQPLDNQPDGALNVSLRLDFANASDSIAIGGLGLLIEE